MKEQTVDREVGSWLRHIPYIAIKKKGAKRKLKDYGRIYIVSKEQPVVERKGKLYLKEIAQLTKDEKVLNFYRAAYSLRSKKDFKRMRIDGSKIHIPLAVKNVKAITDYLNVRNTGVFSVEERILGRERPKSIKKVELKSLPRLQKESLTISDHKTQALYNLFFFKYLSNKYKNICLPYNTEPGNVKYLGSLSRINKIILNKDISCSKMSLSIPKKYLEKFQECMKGKKRFVALPLHLTDKALRSNHANIIIFDKKTHEAEFYDPWGGSNCTQEALQKFIKDLRQKLSLDTDWKIYHSVDFCPTFAYQKLAGKEFKKPDDYGGYCAVWVLWLLEARISNPDISREQFVKYTHSNLAEDFPNYREFIRLYALNIADIGKKEIAKLKITLREPKTGKTSKHGVVKAKLLKKDLKKIIAYLKRNL